MKNPSRKSDIAALVIMIVLAVILIPVLVVNLTLIIKGNVNRDVPPSIFGVAPLAVTSGSMSGENDDSFDVGALIFVKILGDEDKQNLEDGDIVCFSVDDGVEKIYVTHRIVTRNVENGSLVSVVTKGDANNVTDGAVLIENVLGICIGSAGGLGGFSMFLQTPVGILVFVGIPVALFIAYDVVRITIYNKKVKAANAEKDRDEELRDKDEEIARLRAMVEQQERAKDENSSDGTEET